MTPRQFLIATSVLFAVAIGLALYVWRLRTREVSSQPPVAVPQHVKPPIAGPMETVTIWVADDDPGILRRQSASIPLTSGRQQRAEELIRFLLGIYTGKGSRHPLQPGADIHSVYLVDPGLVVVDINTAFATGQTSGILTEELTIASIIETLSENFPGLVRAKILVDGKDRDTLAGHADLSGLYEVSQVSDLAHQLSNP